MRIGIDLRPLQLHFKYRGIGIHIIELVNHIQDEITENDTLVFYVYKKLQSPFKLLNLRPELKYETVKLKKIEAYDLPLPFFVREGIKKWREIRNPLSSKKIELCDVWLGFDFMIGMPKKGKYKIIYVIYDLIPLLMPAEYFPAFLKAWRNSNFHEAVRDKLTHLLYKWAIKKIVDNSDALLPISDATSLQINKIVPASPEKIHRIYLGSPAQSKEEHYSNPDITKNNYILYIGGADSRRKVDDLIQAFTKLKIEHRDIKLVLVGFDFKSVSAIPNKLIQKAIKESIHKKDIILLGFIDDSIKSWLYKNAICFAYPTLIEGFGLPILEAMYNNCPIVAYSGELSSVAEIGNDGVLIVKPYPQQLYKGLEILLSDKRTRTKLLKNSQKMLKLYSWKTNAQQTLKVIKEL